MHVEKDPLLLAEGLRPSGVYPTPEGGRVLVRAFLNHRLRAHEVLALSGEGPTTTVTLRLGTETVTADLSALSHHRETRQLLEAAPGAGVDPIHPPGTWVLTAQGWRRVVLGRPGGNVVARTILVTAPDGDDVRLPLAEVRRTVRLEAEMRWHGHWFWAMPADERNTAIPGDATDVEFRLWYRDGDEFDAVSRLPGVKVKHPYAYDAGPWVTVRLGNVEAVRTVWTAEHSF